MTVSVVVEDAEKLTSWSHSTRMSNTRDVTHFPAETIFVRDHVGGRCSVALKLSGVSLASDAMKTLEHMLRVELKTERQKNYSGSLEDLEKTPHLTRLGKLHSLLGIGGGGG